MHRILILTAGYGEGHNAAARALAAAVKEAGHEVVVRDLFLETYGKTQEFSRGLYLGCIEHAPWLWAIAYHTLDHLPLMRFVITPLLGRMRRHLAKILEEWKPDSVVSVYPGYSYLLDRLYPRRKAPFARHTLVTDSLTVNSIWFRGGSDAWLVPNEATAEVMREALVPAKRVHVTGFPVPTIFADERPERKAPGQGEPLRILFMTNAARGNAPETVRRLLTLPNIALTVTTGKDAALAGRLETLARAMNRPIAVHEWTQEVPQLLMRHHILIGKAGGAATQEALAACTPMIITKIVPCQELGNAQLIQRQGCGAIATTPDAVFRQVEALLQDECSLLKKLHRAIQALSRPDAARETARFVLNFHAPLVHA